jgi:UDP-2-acetamido-2-deoxy-ribo-hexuluronate aminotransferase
MEFIDLAFQQKRIKKEISDNMQSVFNHGRYIMGPEVSELEEMLAAYTGVKHAVGCASGTDALLMALMAYNIGPGDVIFTTPFTFIATAEVIGLLQATPIFVDIDPITYNIDPAKLELAVKAFTENDSSIHPLPKARNAKQFPKGIITVDLFGLPADHDRINAVAKEYDLFVIEDAAQSFGAEYKEKKACSLADIGCTSFFPAKPLGCYGDGGMCFTDDDHLGEALRSIRVHGQGHHKYDNVRIGINGRLDTLQAAILIAKFGIFPEEVVLRQKVAQRYNNLLSSSSASIVTPKVPEFSTSVWAQYSLLAEDEQLRSTVLEKLKQNNIPSAIYYPKPLHLQDAFEHLDYKEKDFPVSEDYARRIFSLPMHPYLAEKDQEKIAKILFDRPLLD